MTMTDDGSWSVLGLPRSHWHAQLNNFEWEGVKPKGLKKAVESFLESVEKEEAPHLIMTGDPGVGKSHIGVGIWRQVVQSLGTRLAIWLSVPDFCTEVKRSYGPGMSDPWDIIEEAKNLVVLDDLFGRELSGHEISQIISRLIDTCYQNNAALVVTMNPSIEELSVFLRPHEVSRILANSIIIPVRAESDWRRK